MPKIFSLKTSRIRGELSYLEVRATPLFKSEFQTIMLECADIPKRVNRMRWGIKGEIRKLKVHKKMCIDARFSVHKPQDLLRDFLSILIGFTGIDRDVTARKQPEEVLKKAHDELKERSMDLEIKRKGLEELNTAMRVLLKKRDADKAKIEKSVLANVKQLIEPTAVRFKFQIIL